MIHDIKAILPLVKLELQNIPDVLGVGIGLKELHYTSSQLSWRIYVSRKFSKKSLLLSQNIPSTFFNLANDIITRHPTNLCHAVKISGGKQIINNRGLPGTAGTFLSEKSSGLVYLISNHHVLFGNGALIGESIWSPSGSSRMSEIGNTSWGKFGNHNDDGQPVFVDVALGEIKTEAPKQVTVRPEIADELMPGDVVCKIGAGTGFTKGVVIDVAYPDQVQTANGFTEAPNQLLIQPLPSNGEQQPFSGPGDSGAIVMTENGRYAGLLWGSNAYGEGVATPIGPILSSLPLRDPELISLNHELTIYKN